MLGALLLELRTMESKSPPIHGLGDQIPSTCFERAARAACFTDKRDEGARHLFLPVIWHRLLKAPKDVAILSLTDLLSRFYFATPAAQNVSPDVVGIHDANRHSAGLREHLDQCRCRPDA